MALNLWQPKESQDLRSEAFLYNKLRRDYQAKAQENFQRGMAAVAAYYASEVRPAVVHLFSLPVVGL